MNFKGYFTGVWHTFLFIVGLPKWLYKKLEGWKTRLMMMLGVLLQLAVLLDPVMISNAFGLDQQGAAKVSLALFLLGWLARELARKPGALGKMLGKSD